MSNYQTISALVSQIPEDTWDVLREIKERHPAMMLLELIDWRRRALRQQEPREPQSQSGISYDTSRLGLGPAPSPPARTSA
jgi:hypothetical protein